VSNGPRLSYFKITESSLKYYYYSDPLHNGGVPFPTRRWFPLSNPYSQFSVSQSYPQGFAVTAISDELEGSPEVVIQNLYLHHDKQSLIRYGDGTYYIYQKAPARDTDDGVPKRITITGVPHDDYTGGSPSAVLNVISFFDNAPTISGYAHLQDDGSDTITIDLYKGAPGTGGPAWTGTGYYRLWLTLRAANYRGQVLEGQMRVFAKNCVIISGAETVIPLTSTEWEGWPDED
jgi:hypothetical protein